MDGVGRTDDVIERRLAVVEAELTAVAGEVSLCTISRTAGSVPTAKYLEGRLAALMAVRRRARSASEPTGSAGAARDLVAEWRAEYDRDAALDRGPDWRAYRAGGIDELVGLVEQLDEMPRS